MSTTTTEVTAKDLIAEVRRLAAENPDFRYADYHSADDASCVYNATPSKPACIMGQALVNLGHPVDLIYEGTNVVSLLRSMNRYGDDGPRLDSPDEGWLRSAQRHQDEGATWAEAVHAADLKYPNV